MKKSSSSLNIKEIKNLPYDTINIHNNGLNEKDKKFPRTVKYVELEQLYISVCMLVQVL